MNEDTPQPTILAVDDDEELLDLIETWFADDYRVLTAADGRTALQLFDRTVDVVLLDRKMPGLYGDEVLRRLRNRPGHCRVVMVTAATPTDDIVPLPFDDYIVKPVGSTELHNAVERALERVNYGQLLDELYSVASRIAILETHIDGATLEANEDYRALTERFDRLQAEFETVTNGFSNRECWDEFARSATITDRIPQTARNQSS